MSFEYCNVHPKGKIVDDCVKRAICKSTGIDYMEVQRMLNRIKREIGAKKFNDNSVCEEVVRRQGWKVLSFPAQKGKPRMNGNRFCEAYPKGSYILRMAGHWSACIDGVIYDTWDCSEKCVYKAFEVK